MVVAIDYKSVGQACSEVLQVHEQYLENRYM